MELSNQTWNTLLRLKIYIHVAGVLQEVIILFVKGNWKANKRKCFSDVIQSQPHLNHADQWIIHVLTPELNEFVFYVLWYFSFSSRTLIQ